MARSRNGSKVQLPSGRWRVSKECGRRVDGSRRVVTEVVDTEAEADARLLALSLEMGSRPDLAGGLTLSAWWETYQATKGSRLARATLRRYKTCMEAAWLPALGERDISMISRADVQQVLLGSPTGSEAAQRRRALSAVLGQAVTDGILSANPCRGARFELPGDVGAEDRSGVDFSEDPFAAIEGVRNVWGAADVMAAMPRLEGAPLETAWLVMVGAGLRREEALALTWRDVRRVELAGRPVVQVAVHAARTAADGLKRTKGTRSVRIVAVAEPFASRLWELRGEPDEPVCAASPNNAPRQWRRMWEPPSDSPHVPRSGARTRGRMLDDDGEPAVPFLPLSRMRATHETLMQQAGVLDSVNAAAHGHSQAVSYRHYQMPDVTDAALSVGGLFP